MKVQYKGKEIIIDKPNLSLLNKYEWYYIPQRSSGSNYYLARSPKGVKKRTTIYFHREIMNQTPIGKDFQYMVVDHKNRNTLDFRKKNLRIVSQSENRINSKVKIDCKSGEKHINLRNGKFTVMINRGGKQTHIGVFRSIEAAILRRDEALSPLSKTD